MQTQPHLTVAPEVSSELSGTRILVVEDERIVALDLSTTLRELGYVVAGVSSGEAAVKQAGTLRPDLILMDIRLPGGMDGISAAQAIQGKFDIPVIYLSAHSDVHTLARAKDTAPYGYVIKPYKALELHCAIEIALHKHKREAELRRSEERYRSLVESSTALICTHDLEGNLLSINSAAASALGYTVEELVGRNIRGVLTRAAQPYFDSYLKTIQENQVADGNMNLIGSTGRKLVWSYTNRLIHDPGRGTFVLGHAQDITERLEMQEALRESQAAALATEKRLSRTDALTGVANRRAFYETAEAERKRSVRYGRPVSLAYIDLDNFKQINDQSGHETGDQVLACVAETLRKNIRAESLVARLGGDEFAVLLPETDQVAASLVTNKLRDLLATAMREKDWPVTFSVGVVTYDKPPQSTEQMMHAADELMYRVKREGKNSVASSLIIRDESESAGSYAS
jgi:diguanylate cyclase (GGDEF)-like protein/PAS domain S-box-containing protein